MTLTADLRGNLMRAVGGIDDRVRGAALHALTVPIQWIAVPSHVLVRRTMTRFARDAQFGDFAEHGIKTVIPARIAADCVTFDAGLIPNLRPPKLRFFAPQKTSHGWFRHRMLTSSFPRLWEPPWDYRYKMFPLSSRCNLQISPQVLLLR